MSEYHKKPEGEATPWSGRFEDVPSEELQRFGASLPIDKRMWREDIAGSKAHANMIGTVGVISREDADAIIEGLGQVEKIIEQGDFVFDIKDEDIHMAVEKELTRLVPSAGGKLHTGRSRNDQVATDNRLVSKRMAKEVYNEVMALRVALVEKAHSEFGTVIPGFTHMQKAQPVLLSHHMLAYYWMFVRDCKRIKDAYDAADVSPLGSAALAGTTYPLDRFQTAEELGFASVGPNSLDNVSDRDFLCDLLYACSMAQLHMSRMCEELIYWSSQDFHYITMSDKFSTGSSIMPQKKNPDFAELVRGKSGRVIGDLVALLMTLKALPLAYNKDMQEDKEGMFDAVDTVCTCLRTCTGMIKTMKVNAETTLKASQGGFMAATDLADYLVGKGMAFRDAHSVVGALVLKCEKEGKTLQSLSAEDYTSFNKEFGEDVLEAVDIEKIVSKRNTFGGTGHDAVKQQMELAEAKLHEDSLFIDNN